MVATRSRNAVDQVFRAFSDRTRLRILSILRQGEHCVGDLVEILKVPQPKVSRHLAYLRKTGLVETREKGLWNFYKLAAPKDPFHKKMLECLMVCYADVPEINRDAGKARTLRVSGGCCSDSDSCEA